MKRSNENILSELGNAIGKGLLAGLAGTAAITISQMMEMSVTKRKPSEATIKVAEQVIDVKPSTEESKTKVSQEIHWTYGTCWGIARGLIACSGLRGLPAITAHFAAIWATSLVMLPAFKAGPKITEEDAKTIAIDAMHHAVYATAAGLAYDAIDSSYRKERKLDKLIASLNSVIKKIKT